MGMAKILQINQTASPTQWLALGFEHSVYERTT